MSENGFKTEYLGGGIYACVSDEHTFGTDAVLLARFANARKRDKCCDLGTGCGIIPLLWLREKKENSVFAVEIQQNACELVKEAVKINSLEEKLQIVNCDLRLFAENLPMGEFSVVTFNPPYFSKDSGEKSPNESVRIARHEIMSDVFDGARCASHILKYGGRFCVCHRPERLADVFEAMRKSGIEPKKMTLCRRKKGMKPFLVLVEGKKGGKCGLSITEDIIMTDENGNYIDGIYGDYEVRENG